MHCTTYPTYQSHKPIGEQHPFYAPTVLPTSGRISFMSHARPAALPQPSPLISAAAASIHPHHGRECGRNALAA
jgi:hypothetical protein